MSRTLVLEPGSYNVLDLDYPHVYHCKVIGYFHQQSILLIQVTPEKDSALDTFYVIFDDVVLFDGVLRWQGANLRVATSEEHFNFLMNRALVATSQELLIFEGGEQAVRLLASSWIAILDELPERFR